MSNFGRFRTAQPARSGSSSGRSRTGRPLRPYEWRPFVIAETSIPINTIVEFTLVSEADLNEMNSPTVMRVRALGSFRFATSTGSIARGAIGMQVRDVSDVTVMDPFARGDNSDWFVWQPWIQTSGGLAGSIGESGLYLDLDSRSMRKIGPRGHDIRLSIMNFGAAPTNLSVIGRILFKS